MFIETDVVVITCGSQPPGKHCVSHVRRLQIIRVPPSFVATVRIGVRLHLSRLKNSVSYLQYAVIQAIFDGRLLCGFSY